MRHRRSGKKFNRNTKARAALLKSLSMSLIRDGHVTTTVTKARELQRVTDKLVTIARKGDVAARRQLQAYFGKRDVANTLVDRYVPALSAYNSGVTTLQQIGPRRGDNAEMATVRWVVTVPTGLSNPNPKSLEPTAKKAKTVSEKAPAKKSAKKAVKTAKTVKA